MIPPFTGGPFPTSSPTTSSASPAPLPPERATSGPQPPSAPEAARPAAPEDGGSFFADLPESSDPLFAAITNREFESLTTLFHETYRGARARMPWCGWLTFMDPSALVVDPPGAPHIFPGSDDWRPRPPAFLDSLRHSDSDPEDNESALLRALFEHIFSTGRRADLPPCAARLRRTLQSPASTTVLARAGGIPPSRSFCLTETGTTSNGISDLLKVAARLLSLARSDPDGIPSECTTSLHRQYGADDMDRRLGLMLPTCPAQRHARSALSLLASHFGGYTWHPWPRPSSPARQLPVQFILDRALDVVEDCLRWAWHVMVCPASEFPVPPCRQFQDVTCLSEWDALLTSLIRVLNTPVLSPAEERLAQTAHADA